MRLLCAVLPALLCLPACAEEFKADTAPALRIENEYKINVPSQISGEVWAYLQRKYDDSSLFLKRLDPSFESEFSEELFQDCYYDTPDLKLYKNRNGIRLRTRFIPNKPDDPKNGKRLVQIKLSRPRNDDLNRSEFKYSAADALKKNVNTGLLGHIKKKDQAAFLQKCLELGIDARSLKRILLLEQFRKRVYISLAGEPFLTLTLDHATSKKWWKTYDTFELEVELNEINYTAADKPKRKKMEKLSRSLYEDIFKTFPSIQQDQKPKYNKAFDFFKNELPLFESFVKMF